MRPLPVLLLLALLGRLAAVDLLLPAEALRPQLDHSRDAVRIWRELFAAEGAWQERDLLRLAAARDGLQLLAARLLHDGPPWAERGAARPKAGLAWRERDRAIKAGILRELRYRPDADLMPVYAAFLARNAVPGLLTSAVVNARELDTGATVELLARLADPDHPQALAPAGSAEIRMQALALLMEVEAADPAAIDAALAPALLRRDDEEREQAVRLLLAAGRPGPHAAPALARLLAERRAGTLTGLDRRALVMLLELAEAPVGELLGMVLAEQRELAAPAAAALLRRRVALPPETVPALGRRCATCTDVPLRHLLLALLTTADRAAARRQAGPGSPWTVLGLHRDAMAAWARP